MATGPKAAIPGTLNIALTVVAITIALSLLWLAAHTTSWVTLVLAALSFSYVNNTLFSLLHESVHQVFHRTSRVNDWFGRVTAAFFPTAFTFQRICHLGHHQRNRTVAEQFDYYRPADNKGLKYLQWYGILTGLYWLVSPIGCLLYLLSPLLLASSFFRSARARWAQQTGTAAMLSGFDEAPVGQVRLEILLSVTIQGAIIALLDLNLVGWLCCYAAFAVNWSSLQYADHAWSELDILNGAWNLKVNRLVQFLFLNYHHHRAHHQHPRVSWLYLSHYVDFSQPRPSFLRIYLQMWLGPRPYPSTTGSTTVTNRHTLALQGQS